MEAVRYGTENEGFPVGPACRALHISRASYYQWRSGKAGGRVAENQRIAQLVQEIHRDSPDQGIPPHSGRFGQVLPYASQR